MGRPLIKVWFYSMRFCETLPLKWLQPFSCLSWGPMPGTSCNTSLSTSSAYLHLPERTIKWHWSQGSGISTQNKKLLSQRKWNNETTIILLHQRKKHFKKNNKVGGGRKRNHRYCNEHYWIDNDIGRIPWQIQIVRKMNGARQAVSLTCYMNTNM